MHVFFRESYSTEFVAIDGVAVLLATGVLPYQQALTILANPAPWTIAAMFMVMVALARTGALEAFANFAERQAKTNSALAISLLIGFVVLASAFVSSTPVFVQLARSLNIAASKLLIPLSYAAVLGGTLTLIGTSANRLVDGVARAQVLAPFSIFEVTPLGIVLVAWGMVYLRFIAPLLLPDRASIADFLSDKSQMKFFTEAVVPPGSDLIGRPLTGVQLFKRAGVRLMVVLRGDISLRRNLQDVCLMSGDRVVLRSQVSELLSLQRDKSLWRVDQVLAVETITVEVLIIPGCKMIGRRLGDMRLWRRFGVYHVALHRRNQNIGQHLEVLIVKIVDTLLIEGNPADIQRLAVEIELVDVSHSSGRAFRRSHAPIALSTLVGIVVCVAFGVAPLFFVEYLRCRDGFAHSLHRC